MSSWKEFKLVECIEVINGYAFKSQNFLEEQIENSLPVVKIKNVANGDVNLKAVQFHLFDKNLEKYLIQKNDVLIALTGNHPQAITQVVGEASKYKLDELAFLNQRVAKIKARENMSNDFLYYFLKDDASHDYLASQSSGSANQANISKSDIENMPISLPPLEEQKAIAEVLSSLDDKIDLLHRQNQTLESLAQTLFRQWFIEEAKEEWEEKPLSEIALHIKNNVKPSSFENKLFFHFSLPAFDNEQRPTKELGREILSNKYQVLKNSILVSKLNPRTPRIWLIDENIEENDSICSTEFQVLYPKEEIWRDFIYCFLKTEQSVQELAGASSGTSGSHQRVKPEDIFNLTFLYPDMDTLKKFEEQSSNYWRKIKVNQKQIQTLENLRDTLLPKLLSGEIRVKFDN